MWGVYQLLASTVHSGLEKLIQKYVKSAFYLKGARWRSMVAKKTSSPVQVYGKLAFQLYLCKHYSAELSHSFEGILNENKVCLVNVGHTMFHILCYEIIRLLANKSLSITSHKPKTVRLPRCYKWVTL